MSNMTTKGKHLPQKVKTYHSIKAKVPHQPSPITLEVRSWLTEVPHTLGQGHKVTRAVTDSHIQCYANEPDTFSVSGNGSDGTLYDRCDNSASISEEQLQIITGQDAHHSDGEPLPLEPDRLYPKECQSYPPENKELIKQYLTLADEDIETFGIEFV